MDCLWTLEVCEPSFAVIDHFLFGTDSPPLFVLKREGVDLINKLGLTAEEKNQVYYENAKKLLKL